MASESGGDSRSPSDWERFRAIVAASESLQCVLRDEADVPRFVRRLVELGAEQGCRFEAADVESALRAAALEWLQSRASS